MPHMETATDVAVDPATAFTVFTEELDQWWLEGPINAWDSTRATGRCFEPGVGGRILELYGTDEPLELGRITHWEPPARLAWRTADDISIEVTFTPAADGAGTTVRVTGDADPDNTSGAGFSWVRMIHQWLPRHLDRRATGRRMPSPARLGVVLKYAEPVKVGRWLNEVLQLEATGDIDSDAWVELRAGDGLVILWKIDEGGTVGSDDHSVWVYVDDLDAHLAHAEAGGATIVQPIVEHGFRSYVAADIEGRRWTFVQAPPALRDVPAP